MKTTILMLDDDPFFLKSYTQFLNDDYNILCADNTTKGIKLIEQETPDLLLLDISMNTEYEGLDILPYLQEKYPWLPVIMVTNIDKHSLSTLAQQKGAVDYFVKSSDLNELKPLIKNTLQKSEKKGRLPEYIIAESPEMKKIFSNALRVARFDVPVLLSGPSGVGKEVLARFIHQNSRLASGPFVAVNCGGLTDSLMESILFGHEKGAFTGAIDSKQGKIQQANGGTLFLDELEDLSPRGQVSLLRVLQEQEIQPLGSNQKVRVHFRLIAAVKTNMQILIKEGKFREDLYFRITVSDISIPPLRKRREDIVPLGKLFIKNFCEKAGIKTKVFNQSAIRLLQSYDWPGNVRELKNVVERAVLNSRINMISASDLQLEHNGSSSLPYEFARQSVLKEFRKEFIEQALSRNQGNISATAKDIGLSRTALQKIMKELPGGSAE